MKSKPTVHRSSFEVTFLDKQDLQLASLKPAEEFILAVDLGTELLDKADSLSHRTNTLIIWLADDWTSTVLAAIREHVANGNEPFKVMVKITNGRVVKDIFVYSGCALSALQHSIFTRENQDERVELSCAESDNVQTGTIKPPVAREASAKLLQVAFTSFEHHIIGSIQ